jgi:hypothetical protein
MKKFIAGCLVAMLINAPTVNAQDGSDTLDLLEVQRGVFLPPTMAGEWFGSGAKHVDGLWTPSEAQVARMETALGLTLTQQLIRYQSRFPTDIPIRTSDYYRKYVAAYYRGKPTIFINGFHKSFVEQETARFDPCTLEPYCPESDCAPPPKPVPCELIPGKPVDFWHHEIVTVYDGGNYYFSAAYDVDAHVITAFSFNGSA